LSDDEETQPMKDLARDAASASDSTQFTCEVVPERDAVRVRPHGALDMATASTLEAEITQLRDAGFRRLLVDLSALDFLDSSGLRLLLSLHAEASNDGFALGLVRGNPTVQRVFEITGTAEILPFTESRAGSV
jgi:anti-anti-sigma factor